MFHQLQVNHLKYRQIRLRDISRGPSLLSRNKLFQPESCSAGKVKYLSQTVGVYAYHMPEGSIDHRLCYFPALYRL